MILDREAAEWRRIEEMLNPSLRPAVVTIAGAEPHGETLQQKMRRLVDRLRASEEAETLLDAVRYDREQGDD